MAPGAPAMNSFWIGLRASQAPCSFTVATTSAGSPSIGNSRGQASIGRHASRHARDHDNEPQPREGLFACDGTLQAVQTGPLEAESDEQRQHPDDMHEQRQ
jgi:hypothetical protein